MKFYSLLLILSAIFCNACLEGWALEDSQVDEHLYAIWGASGKEVFAVGANGTVLKRQGGRFQTLESGTQADLLGVFGTAADQVLVVGSDCTALRYSGPKEPTADGEDPLPDLDTLSMQSCADYRDIHGSSGQIFAVGANRIQQYNGSNFVNYSSCGSRLLGVSVCGNFSLFATGDNGDFCRYDHVNGWKTTRITICPEELEDSQCPVTDPELLIRPILWDVWVSEKGQGAIVGSSGTIWRYPAPAEGPWLPEDSGLSGNLYAIHGRTLPEEEGIEMFAVGDYGAVFRITADSISRQETGTHENLHGVWVDPEGKHVYAVGENGTITHLTR